jgi:starch phosphorylase
MDNIRKYKVIPSLPEKLAYLKDLAYNLYWTWDYDIRSLFRRLDRDLWESSGTNPALMLGSIDQKRLETRARDEGYLSHLARAREELESYLSRKTWFQETNTGHEPFHIAYFSMEYGLDKSLPIYSGGLAILSADHLKSASDLGIPLLGIGLLYQQGYFHQYLSKDGWQQETFPDNDFYNLPIKLEKDAEGNPLTISVDFPQGKVFAQIWRAQVGRVPLYLLDTNIPVNSPDDQNITDQLYGGDNEMRIKQEIVLGIGGIRALEALGIRPQVCHMNEGHSAFMALERARLLMQAHGLSFAEAQEATRGGNVFTSHTPVPAGIDEFDPRMIDYYLGEYYNSLKITQEQFHHLGGVHYSQTGGKFNMAIFAINMSANCNGVSRLHGRVARKMWHYLWPDLPEREVPIKYVTNGVHVRTWISEDMAELFNRYLGPSWHLSPVDTNVWSRVQQIPDEELWRTHERRRERLVAFTRAKLQQQMTISGSSPAEVKRAQEILNPEALTIGFGRRFAEYKRALLIFKDIDRLIRILSNKDFPVQIIFAGKAHPRDNVGKGIIRDLVNIIRRHDLSQKVVFIEDYDMQIASYMTQGADVWLNTPRRPREASGTSGMKAGINGALNLSVLDGWWDEAYKNDLGWAIGRGEEYGNFEDQDRVESEAVYYLLEKEIIPLFYTRGSDSLPRDWVKMMKSSIQHLGPNFNTSRMVQEYFKNFYLPAAERWSRLTADDMAKAKSMAKWTNKVRNNWDRLEIQKVESEDASEIKVGQQFKVSALINIDGLKPEDLRVEVYYGRLNPDEIIEHGQVLSMNLVRQDASKTFLYEVMVPCEATGQHGFAVRLIPNHPELLNPHEIGLITWEEGEEE